MKCMTKGLGLILAMALLPAFSLASSASSPVDAVSDGPQSWSAPPYWVSPAVSPGEQSARTALAAGRQALVTSPVPLPFVAVTPCRMVDTRGNDAPLTGGFLPAATTRSYTLTGICNIPANAQAISLNATVVNPVGSGHLVLWPEGGAQPHVSTLNYVAGQTVANAAVVPLSGSGGISMVLGVSGGDVILDTNGYYSPLGVVNSLNGQAGDLTLAAGTNVTLTPVGNTLTINAPLTVGPAGPAGATGTVGTAGPAGATGATGATGSQGSIGLTGTTGSQGPIGLTGNQGNQGFVGPIGPQGAQGATGPQGATGLNGTNAALVFGPYPSSSQDTSGCSTGPTTSTGEVYWADDTFTRTYIVKPNVDGSFDVTELFDGTFTTVASGSPTNCSVPLNAGITGQFYGNEVFGLPPGLDFDFKATCLGGCTGSQFFAAFFNTTPPGYAFQFHYNTTSNGSWNNTDHGNTGDIHNN